MLTSIGLVVISPLLLVIAAAIKLYDGGPVIFRQTRVGRGGEMFTMLKFRSMVVDAEARKQDLEHLNEGHGALFKMTGDPRVTPLAGSCGRSPRRAAPAVQRARRFDVAGRAAAPPGGGDRQDASGRPSAVPW